jgi:hypothetical protein
MLFCHPDLAAAGELKGFLRPVWFLVLMDMSVFLASLTTLCPFYNGVFL